MDAADYLNGAWLKFLEYSANPKGPPIGNVEAFVVRIALNLARDDYRRRARQAQSLGEDQLDAVADSRPLADEVLDSRQRLQLVHSRLQRLPERTREIVRLHRVDGLSYREISAQLGISESAVEKHMAKATLALMKARVKP